MALFSKTKKPARTTTLAQTGGTEKKATTVTSTSDLSHVLKHARITEKATMHSASGVYVFNVAVHASKTQIAAAVRKIYNVTPKMVRVAMVPSKMKRSARTGKTGVTQGGKKAYVYLKKGETINL